MRELFRKISVVSAEAVGSSWSFLAAVTLIVVWAISGYWFDFSDTWQLVINTGTTIITFLMVFLIQNTQNRDGKVIQLKLDELLRGVEGARTGLVNLENVTDDELARLQVEFERLRKQARSIRTEAESGGHNRPRS